MTIPPKPRIRNFPEPKSAIARVPPSHHEEEARSKVTSNAQSITISTCLCIMSSRHARERTDALSPPCPRSSSSSSQKSPCHRKTPSRKQATRKASERSVKDPYRKMLCNDPLKNLPSCQKIFIRATVVLARHFRRHHHTATLLNRLRYRDQYPRSQNHARQNSSPFSSVGRRKD